MSLVHRDYKPLVKAAEAQGWTLEPSTSGKGHPRLQPPEGAVARDGSPARSLTIPGTPSDHRSLMNTRADMRRQGIKV